MRSRAYARRVSSMLWAMNGLSRTSSFGRTMKLDTYQPQADDDVADGAGATAAASVVSCGPAHRARRPRSPRRPGARSATISIPFIADVRVGVADAGEDRVIGEDQAQSVPDTPAMRSASNTQAKVAHTPRSSPAVPARAAAPRARASRRRSPPSRRPRRTTTTLSVVSPAGQQLPDGQREQVERPADDRRSDRERPPSAAADPSDRGAPPVERERRPFGRHRQTGDERDRDRRADARSAESPARRAGAPAAR